MNSEKIFWEHLRNRNLLNKKFYRQYPLFYDLKGRESFFVADFYCYESKLIIELDGEYHKYRLTKDIERTLILESLGLKVIRFTNKEVEQNILLVLEKIKMGFKIRNTQPLLLPREGARG